MRCIRLEMRLQLLKRHYSPREASHCQMCDVHSDNADFLPNFVVLLGTFIH